jgi:hypothetical protein
MSNKNTQLSKGKSFFFSFVTYFGRNEEESREKKIYYFLSLKATKNDSERLQLNISLLYFGKYVYLYTRSAQI